MANDFRFKLGQIVMMRSALVACEAGPVCGIPKLGTIVTRWTQECPGGTQLQYDVRMEGGFVLRQLNEMEIVEFELSTFGRLQEAAFHFIEDQKAKRKETV